MKRIYLLAFTAAQPLLAAACSGEATSPSTDAEDASSVENLDDGGDPSSRDGDAGTKPDSSTPANCNLLTEVRPPDARQIRGARYLSPTRIVFATSPKEDDSLDTPDHVFEQDLCDPAAAPKDLGALPGSGLISMDPSGALVVPSAPLAGAVVLGRWKNGVFTQAASDCEFDPRFIDSVGVNVVVSSWNKRMWLASLDMASCNAIELKEPPDELYRFDATAARLSPDGAKVLMGPSPHGGCKQDPTLNDLVLFDIASKSYSRVPYAPATEGTNAECAELGPAAWYPDNERILVLKPRLIEANVKTGTSRELTVPTYHYNAGDPPIQGEVSPDGKSALAIGRFSISVLSL